MLCLTFFLIALVSKRVTQHIVQPINALDLNAPADNVTYPELTPLLKRMAEQMRSIDRYIAELTAQKTEFAAITQNMREALLLLNARGEIVFLNHSATEMFGVEREKCEGQYLLALKSLVTPKQGRRWRKLHVLIYLAGELQDIFLANAHADIANALVDLGFRTLSRFIAVDDVTVHLIRHEVACTERRKRPPQPFALVEEIHLRVKVLYAVRARCAGQADNPTDASPHTPQGLEAFCLCRLEARQLVQPVVCWGQ